MEVCYLRHSSVKASFASDQSDTSKSGQGLRSGFNYSSYRKGGISGQ
ncbi:hypothetical protein A2U01_0089710, partial [Trifolium medium]|nr:hypothetical protein [Trifolium medium]